MNGSERSKEREQAGLDCNKAMELEDTDFKDFLRQKAAAAGIFMPEQDCPLCQRHIKMKQFPKIIQKALFTKYSNSISYFYSKPINNLLSSSVCQESIQLKEDECWNSGKECFVGCYSSDNYSYRLRNLWKYHQFNIDQPKQDVVGIFTVAHRHFQAKRKIQEKAIKRMLDVMSDSELENCEIHLSRFINSDIEIVEQKCSGSDWILNQLELEEKKKFDNKDKKLSRTASKAGSISGIAFSGTKTHRELGRGKGSWSKKKNLGAQNTQENKNKELKNEISKSWTSLSEIQDYARPSNSSYVSFFLQNLNPESEKYHLNSYLPGDISEGLPNPNIADQGTSEDPNYHKKALNRQERDFQDFNPSKNSITPYLINHSISPQKQKYRSLERTNLKKKEDDDLNSEWPSFLSENEKKAAKQGWLFCEPAKPRIFPRNNKVIRRSPSSKNLLKSKPRIDDNQNMNSKKYFLKKPHKTMISNSTRRNKASMTSSSKNLLTSKPNLTNYLVVQSPQGGRNLRNPKLFTSCSKISLTKSIRLTQAGLTEPSHRFENSEGMRSNSKLSRTARGKMMMSAVSLDNRSYTLTIPRLKKDRNSQEKAKNGLVGFSEGLRDGHSQAHCTLNKIKRNGTNSQEDNTCGSQNKPSKFSKLKNTMISELKKNLIEIKKFSKSSTGKSNQKDLLKSSSKKTIKEKTPKSLNPEDPFKGFLASVNLRVNSSTAKLKPEGSINRASSQHPFQKLGSSPLNVLSGVSKPEVKPYQTPTNLHKQSKLFHATQDLILSRKDKSLGSKGSKNQKSSTHLPFNLKIKKLSKSSRTAPSEPIEVFLEGMNQKRAAKAERKEKGRSGDKKASQRLKNANLLNIYSKDTMRCFISDKKS